MNGLQYLVADQAMMHVAEDATQTGKVKDCGNIAYLIAGRHRMAQKALEASLCTELIESIEAGKPREPQNQ